MTLHRSENSYDFQEPLELLSEACRVKHRGTDLVDFYEALAVAIGYAIPKSAANLVNITRIMRVAQWPREQTEADIFLGRYIREYSLMAERGKLKGLGGLDLVEIETLSGYFPPQSDRDKERHENQLKAIRKILARKPCIELFDEARSQKSRLFESIRMILSENNDQKTVGLIASYIKMMKANREPDPLIERRLKIAMTIPRKTTKNQKA